MATIEDLFKQYGVTDEPSPDQSGALNLNRASSRTKGYDAWSPQAPRQVGDLSQFAQSTAGVPDPYKALAGAQPPKELSPTDLESSGNASMPMRIALALEGFGAGIQGREPLFMKMQQEKALRQLETQKLVQQKTQNDWNQVHQVAQMNASWSTKVKYYQSLAQHGNKQAGGIIDMGDDSFLKEIHHLEKYATPDELKRGDALTKGFEQGKPDRVATELFLDTLRERQKTFVKDELDSQRLAYLENKMDNKTATLAEQKEYIKKETERKKHQEELTALQLKNKETMALAPYKEQEAALKPPLMASEINKNTASLAQTHSDESRKHYNDTLSQALQLAKAPAAFTVDPETGQMTVDMNSLLNSGTNPKEVAKHLRSLVKTKDIPQRVKKSLLDLSTELEASKPAETPKNSTIPSWRATPQKPKSADDIYKNLGK